MPDMLWDDVRNFFDPRLMGALPDAWVPGTSVEDWQAVFDLVRSRGWSYVYSEDGVAGRLPRAEDLVSRGAGTCAELRVWPEPGFLVIFRMYEVATIDFDVDLRELQGQTGVDALCWLLRGIGRRLGKPVLVASESDSAHPVPGFDVTVGRVVLLADPEVLWR